MSEAKGTAIRVDLQIIANMISEGSRVLDVGCGNGILLDYLARYKKVDGRGIELSTQGVNSCVSAGLSVVQGDANTDLKDYPNYSFDYVVLSQTLQAMNNPRVVLEQLLRIGRPFQDLHSTHGTAKCSKKLIYSKIINQTCLNTNHISNRNPRKIKTPRLTRFRVNILWTSCPHATTQNI